MVTIDLTSSSFSDEKYSNMINCLPNGQSSFFIRFDNLEELFEKSSEINFLVKAYVVSTTLANSLLYTVNILNDLAAKYGVSVKIAVILEKFGLGGFEDLESTVAEDLIRKSTNVFLFKTPTVAESMPRLKTLSSFIPKRKLIMNLASQEDCDIEINQIDGPIGSRQLRISYDTETRDVLRRFQENHFKHNLSFSDDLFQTCGFKTSERKVGFFLISDMLRMLDYSNWVCGDTEATESQEIMLKGMEKYDAMYLIADSFSVSSSFSVKKLEDAFTKVYVPDFESILIANEYDTEKWKLDRIPSNIEIYKTF